MNYSRILNFSKFRIVVPPAAVAKPSGVLWGTKFPYIINLKVLRGTICRNLDSVDFKIPINNINRKYTMYRFAVPRILPNRSQLENTVRYAWA